MRNNIKINQLEIIKHPIISIKRALHPVLLNQMPERRNFEIKILNEVPKVDGPVLYLVTHSTCHDAPVTCEEIKEHFYVMVGKQPLEFIDNVFFNVNGKIDIDRDDKRSGQMASKKTEKLLSNGVSVVIYPEGTWCTKASTPINHCRRGWVDIAKNTKVPVIPIALEYYEYTDNCCYVNAGKPIIVNQNDSKKEKNDELEEIFTTLKYDIWNQFPMQKRSEVDTYLWKKVMQQRYEEYPKLNIMKEKTYVIGYKNDPDYVFNSPEYRKGIRKLEKIYGKSYK